MSNQDSPNKTAQPHHRKARLLHSSHHTKHHKLELNKTKRFKDEPIDSNVNQRRHKTVYAVSWIFGSFLMGFTSAPQISAC
jgi:hypothetical protein